MNGPAMKVVVIGAGMVGNRFADELNRLNPEIEIDLLGDESYEPYNRVLLTELLAGRVDLAGLALPLADGDNVRVWQDQAALAIDRQRQIVHTADRDFTYDQLVFATGARARVIPIPGLRDGLPRGAHVLRNLNDARDIAAATLNAKRAVVIGGGPLGLEAACGLRHRGVDVVVMSVMDTLLDRDLDPAVADVLETSAAKLGIDFVGGAAIASIAVKDSHVDAVKMANGDSYPADLVVLACGTAPDTVIAADAGLETNLGIVVGDDLRTPSDPNISAIGDCAETPEGVSGLVAPGWAQARALAKSLAKATKVEPTSISGSAMRLKAVGLSVLTMGTRASTATDADRVVTLEDRSAGRFIEVVVRDDTLVGITCVGAPEIGAYLSTQFDRPGVIPSDPLLLLMGAAAGQTVEAVSPTTMPSSTTVCRCNGVTKGDLVHAWEGGCTTVEALADQTLATTGCGGCKELVCGIVDWLEASDPPDSESSQRRSADREPTVPAR
ncbi:MAG: FAD-dependent oxidoreductase [Aeromicrobium sp.]